MRKTTTFTVTDNNRDKGKVFKLTEFPAWDAEWWAMRAFLALTNAGVEIPEDVANMGLAGMATLGVNSLGKVPPETVKPLLDEMMQCVEIIPDPSKPNVVRPLFKEDVEEIKTLLKLREAVFKLHVGFLALAAPSTSGRAAASRG